MSESGCSTALPRQVGSTGGSCRPSPKQQILAPIKANCSRHAASWTETMEISSSKSQPVKVPFRIY